MSKTSIDRFLKVFGKRETEVAAIAIVDAGLLEQDISVAWMAAQGDFAKDGMRELIGGKWLVASADRTRYRATAPFIDRCKQAIERDRAEGRTS